MGIFVLATLCRFHPSKLIKSLATANRLSSAAKSLLPCSRQDTPKVTRLGQQPSAMAQNPTMSCSRGARRTLDYQLVRKESYPGIASDFEKTFAVLKKLPCDIFLSDHGSFFSFEQKRERLARGEKPSPFIDPDGYKRFVTEYEKEFRQKVEAQKKAAASRAPKPE